MDPKKQPDRLFQYIDVSAVSAESLAIVEPTAVLGGAAPSRARRVVEPGDTILATVRPRLRRIAQIPPGLGGELCSTAFCVLRADSTKVDQDYLFYATADPTFIDRISSHERGSGYPAIRNGDVLGAQIAVPPLSEQRAIAQVLRTVQRAKEQTEQVIATAQELKRSLLDHLFTHGPRRSDGAPNPVQDSVVGPIPVGWQVVEFGQLFDIQQGKAMSKAARLGVSPFPFLRTANVYWGRLELDNVDSMDFSEAERQKYELHAGDLLVCEGGAYAGRTGIWNGEIEHCYYQNHIHRCRATTEELVPEFFMYWLETAWTVRQLYGGAANTSAIPNISKTRLAAFKVPLAPPEQQRQSVDAVLAVQRKITQEQDRSEALSTLFGSLLDSLMTAKIRAADVPGAES